MKKVKLLVSLILMVCLLMQLPILSASADSATISAPTKAYLGETITVTYTIKCDHHSGLGSAMGNLKYDASYLEVVSAPSNADGVNKVADGNYKFVYSDAYATKSAITFTFKFKVLRAGSAGVSCEASEIISGDLSSETKKAASVGISTIDRSTLSSNANIKKITISAGTLSPSFDPDITNYTVNVAYSVTEVILSCITAEKDSKIEVTGESAVKVGKNIRQVAVLAPNGINTKLYTITIYRASKDGTTVSQPDLPEPVVNPYEIFISGERRYIVTNYAGIEIPTGFSLSTKNINGVDMPVLVDTLGTKTLVYALDNQEATGCYCLYNEADNTFSIYKIFSASSQKFVALTPENKAVVPNGYYYTTYKLGGYLVDGYKYSDNTKSDFFIFYGENEQGVKGYYRFDALDSSVQRAVEFTEAINATVSTDTDVSVIQGFSALSAKEKAVVIAGISLVLVVLALIIITIIRYTRNKNGKIYEKSSHEKESGESQIFLNFIEESQNKKVTFNDDFIIPKNQEDTEEE